MRGSILLAVIVVILVIGAAGGAFYISRRGASPGQPGAGGSPSHSPSSESTPGSEACFEARPGLVLVAPDYIRNEPVLFLLLADNGTLRLWGRIDLDYFASIVSEVRGEQFNFSKIPEYVNDTAIMDRVIQSLNNLNLTLSASDMNRVQAIARRNQTIASYLSNPLVFMFWALFPALPSPGSQGSCESAATTVVQSLKNTINTLNLTNFSVVRYRIESFSASKENVEIGKDLEKYCCYNGPLTVSARVLNITLKFDDDTISLYYLLSNGVALGYLDPETGNKTILTVLTAFSRPVAEASGRFQDKIAVLFNNISKIVSIENPESNVSYELLRIRPDSFIAVENNTLVLHVENSGNATATITKIELSNTTVYPGQPVNVSGSAHIEGDTIVVPPGGDARIRVSLEGTGLRASQGVVYIVKIYTESGNSYVGYVYGV